MTGVSIALFAGLLIGFWSASHNRGESLLIKMCDAALVPAVSSLVFTIGLSFGARKGMFSNFGWIGCDALLLALGGMAGSTLLVLPIQRFLCQREKGPEEAISKIKPREIRVCAHVSALTAAISIFGSLLGGA